MGARCRRPAANALTVSAVALVTIGAFGMIALSGAQTPDSRPVSGSAAVEVVRSIAAAADPFPAEDLTRHWKKVSFIVYGDTRGPADGIISQYERCSQKFDPAGLRCADGKDTGDSCLSDVQLKALKALHTPFAFDFALTNGVRSYPPYNYGHEDQPGAMEDWVTGPKAAEFPLPAPDQQGRQWYYGSGAVRYFFAKDPGYNSLNFDPNKFRARILEISALMDSTNSDLSNFRRHGGRLIIKENGNDFAQSANAGIGYYKSVVARMGQNSVDRFLRLYVTPGANHAGVGVSGTDGSPVPNAVDLLGAIDDWVVKGKAPDVLTQKAQGNAAPFGVLGSRPLCRYPLYPHYEGGAPKEAASFVCRTQAAAPGRMSSHDH